MRIVQIIIVTILLSLLPFKAIAAPEIPDDVIQHYDFQVGNQTIYAFYIRYTPKENVEIKINDTVLFAEMSVDETQYLNFCSLDSFIEVKVDGVVVPSVKLSNRNGVEPAIVTDFLYCTYPTNDGYRNAIFSSFTFTNHYDLYDGHPSGKISYFVDTTILTKETINRFLTYYFRTQPAIIIDGKINEALYPYYWTTAPSIYPFSDEDILPLTEKYVPIVQR